MLCACIVNLCTWRPVVPSAPGHGTSDARARLMQTTTGFSTRSRSCAGFFCAPSGLAGQAGSFPKVPVITERFALAPCFVSSQRPLPETRFGHRDDVAAKALHILLVLLVARVQDAEAASELENRLCSFGLLQMILQVLADRQEPDVLEGAMMLVAGLRSEHHLCFLIRRRIGAFLIRIADSDAGMQVRYR